MSFPEITPQNKEDKKDELKFYLKWNLNHMQMMDDG